MGDTEPDDLEAAWKRAVRWLQARDRSAAYIRVKLEDLGYSDVTVAATLTQLSARRFLDDQRFALNMAERLAARGHGSERGRRDLEQAGVDPEMIGPLLEAVFRDEASLARRALEGRYRLPLAEQDRGRAARFLHQRGFPEPVVLAIVGED